MEASASDLGCAARRWARQPLKAVVLIGVMMSDELNTPLARTQDVGVNDNAVLIDHAGVDHRSGQPCLAVSE